MEEDEQSSFPEIDFSKIDASEQAKIVLPADLKEIVAECRDNIKKFDLERLLEEARKEVGNGKGIAALKEDDQEMFCAGMIKLGEALTYCKDRSVDAVKASGVSWFAKDYADVRNYFIHHYMYDHLLGRHEEFKEKIQKLCFVSVLNKKLSDLEETGFSLLSKEVNKGTNKFDFEYMHFIVCLKNEFSRLDSAMEKVVDETSISESLNIFLDNRVRNILSIMVDLLDVANANKNLRKSCVKEKQLVAVFNAEFEKKDKTYATFFASLKDFRNAMCHIESNSGRPYEDGNVIELIQFVRKLQELYKNGYVNGVEEQLEALQKEAKAVSKKPGSLPVSINSENSAQKKVKMVQSSGLEKIRMAYTDTEKKESEPLLAGDSEKKTSPEESKKPRKISSSSSLSLKK